MTSPLVPHIQDLFSFCNAPLTYPAVRQHCMELGWEIEDDYSDSAVLLVRFDPQVSPLTASLAADQPFGRIVYLPLFVTEDTYDCVTGAPPDQKPDFDTAFAHARALFETTLGLASQSGSVERLGRTYQVAGWRGSNAFMFVLQDEFDILFGSEISMWMVECRPDEPIPHVPPHL